MSSITSKQRHYGETTLHNGLIHSLRNYGVTRGNSHEYALDLQQEWLRGPVVELFPLQRVNHAFTASLQSIHLRNFMCLDQGSEPASPIFWFLTKLNIYHEPTRYPDPCLERVEVRTHITDREGAEQTWVVPRKWASEESSWRNIKVFPQNYDGPDFQVTYKTRLRGRSADEVEHTLRRQDNPTLGSAQTCQE